MEVNLEFWVKSINQTFTKEDLKKVNWQSNWLKEGGKIFKNILDKKKYFSFPALDWPANLCTPYLSFYGGLVKDVQELSWHIYDVPRAQDYIYI